MAWLCRQTAWQLCEGNSGDGPPDRPSAHGSHERGKPPICCIRRRPAAPATATAAWGVAPCNVYSTIDSHVMLNAPGDHHIRSILDVMGRDDAKDDPRFMTRTSRVLNCEAVDALIES
jgi:crotonobetainyl-CoA:carnitine CoA-transferase CaiB-like acyl-CoA transferase